MENEHILDHYSSVGKMGCHESNLPRTQFNMKSKREKNWYIV